MSLKKLNLLKLNEIENNLPLCFLSLNAQDHLLGLSSLDQYTLRYSARRCHDLTHHHHNLLQILKVEDHDCRSDCLALFWQFCSYGIHQVNV